MSVGDRRAGDVVEIVRFLGSEDLELLDKLCRRRRVLGLVFMIIGFVIIVGVLFYSSVVGAGGWIWFVFGLFMGSLFVREGSVALQEAKNISVPGGGRYKVFVKVACRDESCGYFEVRERKGNEYVGMVLGEKCPKCGGELVVVSIFSEPEKRIKPIGMPILPGMGAQVGLLRLVWYYFVDMFSPLKVVFRWVFKRESGGEKE